jgi:hypothetical protein
MANAINPVGANIPYYNQINAASAEYQVPAPLIAAVIKKESNYQNTARSGPGASGLMQLMPSTAASLGVTNVWDPAQNINGGTKYLAQQLKSFNGNVGLALAAYNAGPGNVQAAGNNVPNIPETKNYVSTILSWYGGGNIDPSSITNVSGESSSGNPLDVGSNIVNGFQKIFQTLATDTFKAIIMFILFGIFLFFGYKALSSSEPINSTIQGAAKAKQKTKERIKKVVALIPK